MHTEKHSSSNIGSWTFMGIYSWRYSRKPRIKPHSITQQIFVQRIFISFWRVKMKIRFLVFKEVSVWITVISLYPTLFFWCEPMVNHPMENNYVSFISAIWGQTCCVSVSLIFLYGNCWKYFSLSQEGRSMYQNISMFVIYLSFPGFLSTICLSLTTCLKVKTLSGN